MQSSTNNHYMQNFRGNSSPSFLLSGTIDEEKYPSEHLFFEPQPSIVYHHEQDEDDGQEPSFAHDNDTDLRSALNGIENGLAGLQIKGKVRTLSPVLFYQINTRYLIMNNNELKTLPGEIGNLTNLVYLDLSHNRLKTLPSQIGDLLHLKRLYLESNFLKNLPYELGKLNIDDLGLKNNPLGDQILSLFARPNGTREVMNYLREKWNSICSYSKIASYKMSLPWDNVESDTNDNTTTTHTLNG